MLFCLLNWCVYNFNGNFWHKCLRRWLWLMRRNLIKFLLCYFCRTLMNTLGVWYWSIGKGNSPVRITMVIIKIFLSFLITFFIRSCGLKLNFSQFTVLQILGFFLESSIFISIKIVRIDVTFTYHINFGFLLMRWFHFCLWTS